MIIKSNTGEEKSNYYLYILRINNSSRVSIYVHVLFFTKSLSAFSKDFPSVPKNRWRICPSTVSSNRNSCRDTSKVSAIKREETGAPRWTLRITGLLTVVTPSSSQTWQWVGPIRVSREWDQSPVARIAIPNPRKKNPSIRFLAIEIHQPFFTIFFREIFPGWSTIVSVHFRFDDKFQRIEDFWPIF